MQHGYCPCEAGECAAAHLRAEHCKVVPTFVIGDGSRPCNACSPVLAGAKSVLQVSAAVIPLVFSSHSTWLTAPASRACPPSPSPSVEPSSRCRLLPTSPTYVLFEQRTQVVSQQRNDAVRISAGAGVSMQGQRLPCDMAALTDSHFSQHPKS